MLNQELLRLAALRQILRDMERELGLDGLTKTEADVLYAAVKISEDDSHLKLTELQGHVMLEDMPRATFYRALAGLVDKGFVKKLGEEKRSGYSLTTVTPR